MKIVDSPLPSSNGQLAVATTGRIDHFALDQIVRIEAWSNYSKLIFANGKILVVAKVLKRFQHQLKNHAFIRAHNTHLVNMQFISSLSSDLHPSLRLVNGEHVSVSRRRYPEVSRQLNALEIKWMNREAS